MRTETTRVEYSQGRVGVLYLAVELSCQQWKLAFTVGWGQKPRLRNVPAGDLGKLVREIEQARLRFALPAGCRVRSCFEAGRDGFWLHRFFESVGVENSVVDAASVEMSRRARRAKTDRLDAEMLLAKLVRYEEGEKRVWSVVRVPSQEQEDQRHRQRERSCRKKDRTRSINRLKGLLATVGIRVTGPWKRIDLEALRQWDGQPLPAGLRARLEGEWALLQTLELRLRELDRPVETTSAVLQPQQHEQVIQLQRLRSLGPVTAEVLASELLWRPWSNRRQAGSLLGLVPSPRQSGELSREQGISKAGLKRVRTALIELAWTWIRLQPRSSITLWYQQRFAQAGPRLRRVGIVAVARKLGIALWRFVATGVLPEGAELKARA